METIRNELKQVGQRGNKLKRAESCGSASKHDESRRIGRIGGGKERGREQACRWLSMLVETRGNSLNREAKRGSARKRVKTYGNARRRQENMDLRDCAWKAFGARSNPPKWPEAPGNAWWAFGNAWKLVETTVSKSKRAE